MLNVVQTRQVTLFCILSIASNREAVLTAEKIVRRFKSRVVSGEIPAHQTERQLIAACAQSMPLKKSVIKPSQVLEHSESIQASLANSEKFDISAWSSFVKSASDTEVATFVFAKIFGYTEQLIAEAFQVTIGTVRYRLGRASLQLGSFAKVKN
jgi:hypothetical protein